MIEDGFGQNRIGRVALWAFALLTVLFLAAPSFIVVPMSFSGSEFLAFPPATWSLRWYRFYAGSTTWISATRTSLELATITALVAVPVGFMAARGAASLSPRWRAFVGGVVLLPAVVPAILIAVGLYFLFARLDLIGTMTGLAIGHIALAIPIVFVVLSAALAQFDYNQERAARSLGAGRLATLRLVTIPQLAYALFSAALLAFLTSLDEVVVAMLISTGDNTTLTKVMFASLRDKIDPTVAVVSSILLVVATGAVVLLQSRQATGAAQG